MVTGHSIKMKRIAAGLLQKQVASVMGISQQAYAKFEVKKAIPQWKAEVLHYAIQKTLKTQDNAKESRKHL